MIKILYLILFYLIYRITDLVLLVVLLIQTGLNVFSGEPSESIKLFGKGLGIYLQQISEFLSYASEDKPFPFSDWPEVIVKQPQSIDLTEEQEANVHDKQGIACDEALAKDDESNDSSKDDTKK